MEQEHGHSRRPRSKSLRQTRHQTGFVFLSTMPGCTVLCPCSWTAQRCSDGCRRRLGVGTERLSGEMRATRENLTLRCNSVSRPGFGPVLFRCAGWGSRSKGGDLRRWGQQVFSSPAPLNQLPGFSLAWSVFWGQNLVHGYLKILNLAPEMLVSRCSWN